MDMIVDDPDIRQAYCGGMEGSECIQYMRISVNVLLTCFFVRSLIYLGVSSSLVHGIKNERPGFYVPFIFWSSFEIVVFMLAAIGLTFYFGNALVGFVVTVCIAISMILPIYFVLVVAAHRRQIVEMKK